MLYGSWLPESLQMSSQSIPVLSQTTKQLSAPCDPSFSNSKSDLLEFSSILLGFKAGKQQKQDGSYNQTAALCLPRYKKQQHENICWAGQKFWSAVQCLLQHLSALIQNTSIVLSCPGVPLLLKADGTPLNIMLMYLCMCVA